MSSPDLPRDLRDLPLALRLLRPWLPEAERTEVLGDLVDEWSEHRSSRGPWSSAVWLWRQVGLSLPRLVRRSVWRACTGFEPESSRFRPGGPWIEGWIIDLRTAVRQVISRPTVTGLVVLTLALGAGGAAAVGSLVRSYLTTPLPFADEDRLVALWSPYDWSEAEHLMLRPDWPGFASTAIHADESVILRHGDGTAQLLDGVIASAELFETLGRSAWLGRVFEAGDDVEGSELAAVISHRLWTKLGAREDLVGSTLVLDGFDMRILGVMPPDFWFPRPSVDVWIAWRLDPENFSGNYAVVGRLEAGRELASMNVPLERITSFLGERIPYPPEFDKTKNPSLTSLREDLLGSAETPLLATQMSMAAIFLAALANVSSLLLGRVGGRSQDLALRAALGASRSRLLRLGLLEVVLLGLLSAIAACVTSLATFELLVRLLPLGPLADPSLRLDGTLLSLAVAVGLAGAVVAGAAPLAELSRRSLEGRLRQRRSGPRRRLEGGLVVLEVALALFLTVGTAWLVRSVQRLEQIDVGLEADGVAVVETVVPGSMRAPERLQLLDDLRRELALVPGVREVGAVQHLPMVSGSWSTRFAIEGEASGDFQTTYSRVVTPGYFEALRLGILRGRSFREADEALDEPLVVINESLARAFGDEDPIGRRIAHGYRDGWARVIGVVENEAVATLTDAPSPVRYMLYPHLGFVPETHGLVLAAEPGRDPMNLARDAARRVGELAPGVAVVRATTLGRIRDEGMGATPQVLRLVALLGGMALVLGAIGVFGVIGELVRRRAREWSLRLALGQAPRSLARHVMGRAARLLSAGLALGLLACLGLGPILKHLLYEIEPYDVVGTGAAVLMLVVIGLAASLPGAWRASRSDPASLLR